VILSVDPIELISPQLLNVTGVYEAVTVRSLLNEHHWRQVIEVPVRWDLDEIRLPTAHEGVHPLRCGFAVVNFCPSVADADIVGMKIIVHEAVIIGEAMLEEQLVRHR